MSRLVGTAMLTAGMLSVAACATEVDRPVEANVLVAPQPPGAPQGDPAAGRPLYASTCAACHGAEGEGGFGPDLHGSLVAQDYAALVEQITHGQGDMPAFGPSLTAAEIDDVAAYVNVRIAGDPQAVAPVTPSSGASLTAVPPGVDAADGAPIFAQTCASCHGDQGQGTSVAPPIPDDIGFTDAREVVAGGALAMPAFSQFLGAAEIDAVTAYVVTELSER